ncbi:MAG: SOS response-associated peptidase family protein [Pseudomonadota bacterium]
MMCNFEKLRSGPAEIRKLFNVQKKFDFTGNMGPIDKYPRRAGPVIRNRADGEREMVMMEWGHPYYKREKGGSLALKKNGEPYAPTPTTNIRHPHYPMFRDYLTPEHRCLVPSNLFAEPNPRAKEEGAPRNIFFALNEECPLYAFAGIWRSWEGDWNKDRSANQSEVYAFLTTTPNAVVKPHHPKAMPVILHQDDWDTWLNDEWSEAKNLQKPYPDTELVEVTLIE